MGKIDLAVSVTNTSFVCYNRSHKTQQTDGCLFVSGHGRLGVDTFKVDLVRRRYSLALYHPGVTVRTRLVRVLQEGPWTAS